MRTLLIPIALAGAAAALSACSTYDNGLAFATDAFPPPAEAIDPAFLPAPAYAYAADVATPEPVSARVPDLAGATVIDAYGHPGAEVIGLNRDAAGQVLSLSVRAADGSVHLMLPGDVALTGGVLVTGFSAEQIETLPSSIDQF